MKGFSSLPNWAKGTIAVAGTITVIVGGYFAVRGIKRGIQNIRDNNESRNVKGDLNDLNANKTTKQTISDSQASGFASRIFVALNGNGTDESAIYDVFNNVVNDADVLAIIKAFGNKELTNSLLWETVVYKGGLSGAIQDEFDSAEIEKLNSILAGKNIKYRF
jgi:hypothetical protein